MIATDYAEFRTRASRSDYVLRRFGPLLKESVLDVGCYEAPLREPLRGEGYYGIDIAGHPDQQLDLERCEKLPFADGSFRCVLCIEVLEHLDSLHRIFPELFRVGRRHILVSLPNCWCAARQKIERGRGSFLHYGLPLDRPEDRHKWFFNVTQAVEFFTGQGRRLGVPLREIVVTEKRRHPVLTAWRRLRYPGEAYLNRYAHTVFARYEKA